MYVISHINIQSRFFRVSKYLLLSKKKPNAPDGLLHITTRKGLLDTVGKRAGDWRNHLPIMVNHRIDFKQSDQRLSYLLSY